MGRLKKFIAAKAAGSRLGRSQMMAHLGEFEERLLTTFSEFVEHFDGKDTAEKMKMYVFKLAAKIGVFLDSGEIRASQLDALAPALQTIVREVVKREIDVPVLQAACADVRRQVGALLRPLTTGRSCERLDELHDYVTHEARLNALSLDGANDIKNVELKQVLVSLLSHTVVRPNFVSKLLENKKARSSSKKLDSQMEIARLQDALHYKVLLLGAGESGKSTVMSQLRNIHKAKEALTTDETAFYVDLLQSNTVEAMQCMVEYFVCVKDEFEPMLDESDFVLSEEHLECTLTDDLTRANACQFFIDIHTQAQSRTLTEMQAERVHQMSRDPQLQQAMADEVCYVPDSATYYFDNVKRFVQPSFVPLDEDIVMARIRTTGVRTQKLQMPPVQYSFVDVGGQRNERKKWINFFDNVSALFFVVNLAGYNKKLFEDESQNRMHESLQVFRETMALPAFQDTPVFVLLNKRDLFRTKLARKSIGECFPDYTGAADDEEASIAHIEQAFRDCMPAAQRPLLRKCFALSARYKADVKQAFVDSIQTLERENHNTIQEAVKKLESHGVRLESSLH